jgi:DNA polymerase-3 subunit epsilon
VLAVDCQATAGRLLELSWARSDVGTPSAQLIRQAPGLTIPPAVARLTGITDELCERGVAEREAFGGLATTAATFSARPTPAIAHYARFERPWLLRLGDSATPLDLVCTHELSLRLLPTLPRRGLRALAGYFGHSVGELRRGEAHVEATLFVWRHLVELLDERGVTTWEGVKALLDTPAARRAPKRTWPMPRATRLALPKLPGLYRMLRTNGDVLYVGKAASLHQRVNSYFRKQRGGHERTLEMLAQARDLSFEVTGSPLEAALLEPDEIKRHQPPYNVALTGRDRTLWFCTPDFQERAPRPTSTCTLGPFSSGLFLEQLVAFSTASEAALGRGRWAPAREVFSAGVTLLRRRHPELLHGVSMSAALRLGTRLWREGRRGREEEDDDDATTEWTAELVAGALEWLSLRAALARRRAQWFTRLTDASIVFEDDGVVGARLLVIDDGALVEQAPARRGAEPPVPVRHQRSRAERHAGFTVARLDRLRVLTTELKRLVSDGRAVSLSLGPRACFDGVQLARILDWL